MTKPQEESGRQGGARVKLRFWLGRAGTGKTHAALQAIREEAKRSPDGPPVVLLTPEQATFQMERALLTGGHLRASHRAQVLSFERLAQRVMQAAGGGARPRLGELGKRMVLRALIQKHGGELKLFGRAARRQGFVDKLAATLTELKQYRVGPDDLDARARRAADDPVLAVKLHDLALVYRSFTEYTADRFTDPDDVLSVVAGVLPGSGVLTGARVWVDGFTGFTPQELAVLRAVWQTAERMDIALCLDPDQDDDLFAPTRETYERLLNMAAEDRIEVEEPVVLAADPPARFRAVPELAHLERELFKRAAKPYAGALPSRAPEQGAGAAVEPPLKIVAAANPRIEVEAAAREILRLCRERGWRFRDMAVIVRHLEPYKDLIEAVFSHYGIPYFIDSRRSLSHHPLIELVRSALEAAAGQSTEAVIRCLKTDFFPVTRDEVDRLENYALEHGIDGRGWMQTRPWRYVRRYTLEPEEARPTAEQERYLEEINDIRDRAVAPLRRLRRRLSEARYGTELAAAVWRFLEDVGAAATLERWMAEADAAGRPDEVQEHRRAWQGVVQVLDEFAAALGATQPSVSEFRQIVEAGLETLRVGMVPPGLDQVMVGSVERSRQPDIRAALVLGAGDGRFPPAPAEDVIFTDAERQQLAAMDVELSPTSREQLVREQYLIYISLTRASEYLWLSYPAADGAGKEQAPAAVVRRLVKMFPHVPVVSEPVEPASDKALLARVADRADLAATVARRLRRHRSGEAAGPLWWHLYDWIARGGLGGAVPPAAEKVFAALNHHNAVPPLAEDVIAALYGPVLQGSVSRLESYAQCAFKHFARYSLRLQERPRWVLDAAQSGTFVHAALKLFVERLSGSGADWGALSDDEALALADACVDSLIPHLGGEILLSSARHGFLAGVLRRAVRRAVLLLTEHARRGRFRPVHVELTFGRGARGVEPLVLLLEDGGRLELSGQIDRVDTAEDGGRRWVRIIDYKSSKRDLSITEVAHGLSLQLPLYLAAVLELAESGRIAGGPAEPAALVYFPVRETLVRIDAPVPEEKLEAMLKRALRMRGLFIDDPDVLRAMADDVDGGSQLLNVSVTKRGHVDKRSNTTDAEGFAALTGFARRKAAELARSIRAGDVRVAPFALGDDTACRFCPYKPVCQFDPLLEGNGYRMLEDWSRDEAWQRIREAGS